MFLQVNWKVLKNSLLGYWTIDSFNEVQSNVQALMERTAVAATADYVEYKLSELECRVNVQLGNIYFNLSKLNF